MSSHLSILQQPSVIISSASVRHASADSGSFADGCVPRVMDFCMCSTVQLVPHSIRHPFVA